MAVGASIIILITANKILVEFGRGCIKLVCELSSTDGLILGNTAYLGLACEPTRKHDSTWPWSYGTDGG